MHVQRLQVLVITADDRLFGEVTDALAGIAVGADLHHLPALGDALPYLSRSGAFAAANRPDLVLADIDAGAPQLGELLDAVADDAAIERVPFVPMAAADAPLDDLLDGRRVHDVLSRPPTRDELRRVLSYFDEV